MNDAFFGMTDYPDTITAFADPEFAQDVKAPHEKSQRYVWRKGTSGSVTAAEIARRGGVSVSPVVVDDVAVMPGSLATPAVVERTKRKEALLALVQQFADQGFSYTPERDGRISHDTAAAARALFHILLPGYDAPKISPDGEGGLIAVWDQADQKTLLVIDSWRLHLVTNATTPGARYFDDLPFDGERVPDPVAELLPSS